MIPRWKAAVPVLLLMALAAWALYAHVDVQFVDQAGIRLQLPERLGSWQGHELRFCHNPECRREFRLDMLTNTSTCPACGQPLFTMTQEEYEQLPKDTQFLKAIYNNGYGEQVQVSIVLSGRDRESIHRPERCLVGQGFTLEGRTVVPVRLEDGRSTSLSVWVTRRKTAAAEPVEQLGYYAYWFVGYGRETPSDWSRMFWLAWDRLVNGVAHRWAYISIAGRREADSDSYLEHLRTLVPLLHRELVVPVQRGSATTRNPTSPPK